MLHHQNLFGSTQVLRFVASEAPHVMGNVNCVLVFIDQGTMFAYNTTFVVGRGGALVETMTFNQRVVGLTPALAAT